MHIHIPGNPVDGSEVHEIRRRDDDDGLTIVTVKVLNTGETIDVYPYELTPWSDNTIDCKD
jgi:hypothetical protein